MFPLDSDQMVKKRGLILWSAAVFAESIVADGLYKLEEDMCNKHDVYSNYLRRSRVLGK